MPWSECNGIVPKYAVEAGHDGDTLYFARAEIQSGKHVGRFNPMWTLAYFAFKGEERDSSSFEVSYAYFALIRHGALILFLDFHAHKLPVCEK
mgnify:CR=1 FL=1